MKALCTNSFLTVGCFFEEGDVINFDTVENNSYSIEIIVTDTKITISKAKFFNHFKVFEGDLDYYDFEYILCNYVFTDAVFFPEEYSEAQHLTIQNHRNYVIMITATDNEIRVSYPTHQSMYENYEDALDGIQKYKHGKNTCSRDTIIAKNLIEMLFDNYKSIQHYEFIEDPAFIDFICNGDKGAGITKEEYDKIMNS